MNVYGKPILFAILAAVVVLIGTMISTFLPMMVPEHMTPHEAWVKPYSALELEGRDIYIREGCNNCHTQTVRPLLSETARYGEASTLAEGVYDQPFLWGSKRTGPDLHRIGGRYPDSWHVKHMNSPQEMFPESNMPPYPWLGKASLNTKYTEKKMKTLGFPLSQNELASLSGKTELDALVAYLQKLGKDVKAHAAPAVAQAAETTESAAMKNPFAGDGAAAAAGKELFDKQCSVCHGARGEGGIGPSLVDDQWLFGSGDGDLYASIAGGRPGGMPPWEASLGKDNIWRVIAYLRTLKP